MSYKDQLLSLNQNHNSDQPEFQVNREPNKLRDS
jgi:hypothetical protein